MSTSLPNNIHKKLNLVFPEVKIKKIARFLRNFEFSQKVQVPIPYE